MDDPSGRSRNKKKSMRKFFGRKNNVTEEDVISMVHEGRENGVFLSSEARMIKNVFEFDEKDAKDISSVYQRAQASIWAALRQLPLW